MLKKTLNRIMVISLSLAFVLSLSSCKKESDGKVIRIIVGGVIGSGGLFYLVEDLNLLDKYVENARLDITVTTRSPEMNEGILAKRIDGAAMNIINFLIGINVGIPYKIASSLSYGANIFVTNNPNIKGFGDISANDRIAIPDMTQTGGVLLRIAAEKYTGNLNAFDELVIIMNHDDAVAALINNSGGISVTPVGADGVIALEKAGMYYPFMSDQDLFGGELVQGYFTFTESFFNDNTELALALVKALEDACELIRDRDEEAMEILSRRFNRSKEDIIYHLDEGNYVFQTNHFSSIETFGDILLDIGIISSMKPLEEIIFNYEGN